MKKKCDCKVCVHLRKGKIRVFLVMWDDGEDMMEYYYLAANRTTNQFRKAVAAVAQAINIQELTEDGCNGMRNLIMRERGFVLVDDIGVVDSVFVEQKPPKIKGYKVEIT